MFFHAIRNTSTFRICPYDLLEKLMFFFVFFFHTTERLFEFSNFSFFFTQLIEKFQDFIPWWILSFFLQQSISEFCIFYPLWPNNKFLHSRGQSINCTFPFTVNRQISLLFFRRSIHKVYTFFSSKRTVKQCSPPNWPRVNTKGKQS